MLLISSNSWLNSHLPWSFFGGFIMRVIVSVWYFASTIVSGPLFHGFSQDPHFPTHLPSRAKSSALFSSESWVGSFLCVKYLMERGIYHTWNISYWLKDLVEPWLVWLSGLSAGLQTKGRWFDSLSGHMPGLQARFPSAGRARGNHTLMFLSLSFSLPSPLSKNK